ncbi:MAG: DoxX family protein, partial [Bacteroidota bacterium]|nr:DoxX family protein [Bacteroidota bacterium]
MTNKTRKITTIVADVIVLMMVGGGAVAKIIKVPKVLSDFTKLGVGEYTQILGFTELILLGLLLYPKTMRFSYFLICGYFGGAIATHLSHADNPVSPIVPLLVVTLSVVLRDRKFFAP